MLSRFTRFLRRTKDKENEKSVKAPVILPGFKNIFSEQLPPFPEALISHLEKNEVEKVEGIFRIPGTAQEMQALLKLYLPADENTQFNFEGYSLHTIAGTLKLWIRNMDVPLLTFELYESWMNACEIADEELKLSAIIKVTNSLPPAHKAFLKRMLQFLITIVENVETTKMSSVNLAIVFSPTFLRGLDETDTVKLLNDQIKGNGLIQILIDRYYEIFGLKRRIAPKLRREKTVEEKKFLKSLQKSSVVLAKALLIEQHRLEISSESLVDKDIANEAGTEQPSDHPLPVGDHLPPLQPTPHHTLRLADGENETEKEGEKEGENEGKKGEDEKEGEKEREKEGEKWEGAKVFANNNSNKIRLQKGDKKGVWTARKSNLLGGSLPISQSLPISSYRTTTRKQLIRKLSQANFSDLLDITADLPPSLSTQITKLSSANLLLHFQPATSFPTPSANHGEGGDVKNDANNDVSNDNNGASESANEIENKAVENNAEEKKENENIKQAKEEEKKEEGVATKHHLKCSLNVDAVDSGDELMEELSINEHENIVLGIFTGHIDAVGEFIKSIDDQEAIDYVSTLENKYAEYFADFDQFSNSIIEGSSVDELSFLEEGVNLDAL